MNDRDCMLLNAYADGELGPGETAALSARLARDPALAGELRRIRRLKARLAGLRAPEFASDGRAARAAWRPGAVAASLTVAGLIACLAILGPTVPVPDGERISVLALHSEFSTLPASDPARQASPLGGDVPPPDLAASNLRLVAARRIAAAGSQAFGYHYRGPNGCRVTLVIGPALELPGGTALARRWPLGDRTAVLVADGMDPRRFAAVAAYAEAATRGPDPAERLRLALVERTASSRPCA